MSINGITNLNQYAAMQNYKANPAKQSKSTNPTDTRANEPKATTPKAESDNKNDAVKMDLATRKALAKGSLIYLAGWFPALLLKINTSQEYHTPKRNANLYNFMVRDFGEGAVSVKRAAKFLGKELPKER